LLLHFCLPLKGCLMRQTRLENEAWKGNHRRADNPRSVSFTVSAWGWVYATNLSRLQRETKERETSKRHVGEAHSVLITAILLPQRLNCYWCKIVSLRMLTNLRLADLRLATAQQRTRGHNLLSDLYCIINIWSNPIGNVRRIESLDSLRFNWRWTEMSLSL
jgi:hypothetical protein